MTVKQFIKSKTFKCVLVLLCIALISGALLAVLNDVLHVSEEERVLRTIKKIYGQEVAYEELAVEFTTDYGRIDNVYKLADGNFLVKSTGYNGYQQGTVSVWLVGKFKNGAFLGIEEVSIASNEKQTLMSKFTKGVLTKFDGKQENYNVVVGGATFSTNALNNAVNTASDYLETVETKEEV